MQSKARLFGQVKDGEKYRWVFVGTAKNGRLIPVDGAKRYYVRYSVNGARKVVPAGATLTAAIAVLKRIEGGLASGEVEQATALLSDFKGNDRLSLRAAADRWFAELKTLDKAKTTVTAYIRSVDGFLESTSKTYVDEITREDMVAYIGWLRKNLIKNALGEQNNTVRTRLAHVDVFMRTLGKGGLLPAKERPRVTKKTPDRYSVETVKTLLGAANPDDRFLIEFFLFTGCRAMEAAHAEWSDFSDGCFNLKAKPHWGWQIKDREEREIPLPAAFVEEVMRRKTKASAKCSLMFPSGVCKPDIHLIRRLRNAAEAAGLDGRFTLHKFRRTFASMIVQKFTIQTAQKLLGHSDIGTTQKYLAADSIKTDDAKLRVEEVFAGIR